MGQNTQELKYEVWMDKEECSTLCLAGECGQEARQSLEPYSQLIYSFYANSHFDAMGKYYDFMGFGKYKTDFKEDKKPYDYEELVKNARKREEKTQKIIRKYIKSYQKYISKNEYNPNCFVLMEFKKYLKDSLDFKKGSADLACLYASVQLDLGNFGEKKCAKYLERFVKQYQNVLSKNDKAKLFANIACFYCFVSLNEKKKNKKLKYYLKCAKKLDPKYTKSYYDLSVDCLTNKHISKKVFRKKFRKLWIKSNINKQGKK